MKPVKSILFVLSLGLAACGAPATVATTVPSPRPSSGSVTSTASTPTVNPPTIVPAVTLDEPPRNWQLMDQALDHVPGVSADRAIKELLSNRKPQRTVLVAIIDSGIDTAHVDLRANLWTNPKETPGNKQDDDKNGYVDDIHGWDFIGSRNGEPVHFDTFELTREYARCHGKAAASGAPPITDAEICKKLDAEFSAKRTETERDVQNVKGALEAMDQAVTLLQPLVAPESLTLSRVRALRPSTAQVQRAQQIYISLVTQGATLSVLKAQVESVEGQLKYGMNPDYDSRTIVGDKYTDLSERTYGNNEVMGPDAGHGTHVAGIIGAIRGNNVGMDGIAPAVQFMALRTVPDGDERDKDVANAIRYAVDNGAQIISMSFGKSFSPFKSAVDDAARYADSKGVLMIHAAGNDGADLSREKNFPTPVYLDGTRAKNWIEVGASSWKGGNELAASFSNYGKNQVDVFAPGVDVLSTIPGSKYDRMSGTSMAAPVVSGVAALLMSYFPNLDATEVRRIILQSASRHPDQRVQRPGGSMGEMTTFGNLSATGGIVNAYNAVRMAMESDTTKAKP